jgi:glutamyl-Q tRNA(Asp) synthetase
MPESHYRGRFAPSPTGALHLGSLLTAVASFLDARSRGGEWLLRMEDLDPPRETPGAAAGILRTLERLGLYWDGEVLYQSRRSEAYRHSLEQLSRAGLVYPCACSRREIRENALPGAAVSLYPGTCRAGLPPGRKARALRLRVPPVSMRFRDRLQGQLDEWLPTKVGDFVLRRADGLFAYQLAVVVDDALQGISDIVRGADLLDSTGRQIFLQQALGVPTPCYLHLPVVVNQNGVKLSKQTGARPVDRDPPRTILVRALELLGQSVPAEVRDAGVEEFWAWAAASWAPERIPRTRSIQER